MGKTAAMMVVWNAELAQSYIAHARRSRRPSPSRSSSAAMIPSAGSERLPRDPLAEERVHGDVAVALAGEDVLAHERAERRLHGRRAAEAMPRAHVGGQQLAAVLEHRGAERRALRERQALPGTLEERRVL